MLHAYNKILSLNLIQNYFLSKFYFYYYYSHGGTLRHLLKHSVVLNLYDATQKPKHDKCKQCKQVILSC